MISHLRLSRTLMCIRKHNRNVSRWTSTTAPTTTVGFIGLGNMGLPMCLNLVQNSQNENGDRTHSIIAYDTNEASIQKAELGGATPAATLEELVQSNCDIIFTMLPTCAAVEEVVGTLLESWPVEEEPKSGVFVDCSTVSPMTTRRVHDQILAFNTAHKNIHLDLLDAPVSGGVKGAEGATLTFMVGSSHDEALEVVQPLFEIMGSRIFVCGKSGTGSVTKLCNNLALGAQMVGICEAMNLGDALGVDPVILANVMNASTAKCWSSDICNPHPTVAKSMQEERQGNGPPACQNYEGGFGANLMLKDLSLAVDAGQQAGVALPVGVTAKELYRLAQLRGMGDKDFGIMLQFLLGK